MNIFKDKYMSRFFWIFLLSAFSGVVLFGQTESSAIISGMITDAVSDDQIELVTVYIKDTNIAVESAANGRYRIEVPAEKSFTLVFSRIGYKEARQRLEEEERPVLILFGTGSGLAPQVFDSCHWVIEPIGSPGDYNHLSVRSAASITVDRLFG